MPLPTITEKILQAGVPVIDGWSLLELTDYKEVDTSGGAHLYVWECKALQGPGNSEENAGRFVAYRLNKGGLEYGIESVCFPYVQFLSAVTGMSGKELQGQEVEPTALYGKKVWAKISTAEVNGRLMKQFEAFSPATEVPF